MHVGILIIFSNFFFQKVPNLSRNGHKLKKNHKNNYFGLYSTIYKVVVINPIYSGGGSKMTPPCVFSRSFFNGKRYHSAIVGKHTKFYCQTFAKNRMSISITVKFLLAISQGEVSLFFSFSLCFLM